MLIKDIRLPVFVILKTLLVSTSSRPINTEQQFWRRYKKLQYHLNFDAHQIMGNGHNFRDRILLKMSKKGLLYKERICSRKGAGRGRD